MHTLQFSTLTSSVRGLEGVFKDACVVMHGSVTSVVISAVPRCSFVVENIRVSPLSRTFLLNCRNCGYTVHTIATLPGYRGDRGDCGDVPCVLENKVPSVPHSAVCCHAVSRHRHLSGNIYMYLACR